MKNLLIILVFTLNTSLVLSQKYMDEIAQDACDCVTNLSETIDPEDFTMELGLCMINVSIPYKKQLKRDYDIDMDNIAESGEKLGTVIGTRMTGICPNELILLTKKSKENDDSETNVKEYFEEEGVVVKTENNFFITFYLKGENGKTRRYYWMNYIETKEDLAYEYNLLEGKKVSITYCVEDYFDPNILDYRQFFIIQQLKVVE